MKTNQVSRLQFGFLLSCYLTGLLALMPAALKAGEPPADARVQEIENLERQAQKLKADGRHEEAREIMSKIDRLLARDKAGEIQGEPRDPGSRQHDLKRKLTESQRELKRLRKAGHHDQAMALERRVDQLESELRQFEPREGFRNEPGQPKKESGLPEEAQRRLHHLKIAIENLHAAGMHDPAERLTQEAERLRQAMDRRRPAPGREPGGDVLRGELNGLRQELRELRQAVQELRVQMERLKIER